MEIEDKNLDKEIRKRALELNNSYPLDLPHRELLWESIQKRKRKGKIRTIQIRWSIAATVALFIIAGLGVFHTWTPKSTPGNQTDLSVLFSDIPGGSQAYEYIHQVCKTQSGHCKSEQFLSLQTELQQSSLQIDEIEKQISLFGPDQRLINAKTRVQKHQYRILKAIVQII